MVRDKIRLHNTHENCEKIIKKFRFQQKAELSMARGNNSNPLRLFAILLEKYPIDRLAGGAFAL